MTRYPSILATILLTGSLIGILPVARAALTTTKPVVNAPPLQSVEQVLEEEAAKAAAATQAKATPAPTLVWQDSVEDALVDASIEYRSVFLLATSPTCGYCRRLKQDVLSDPEVREVLSRFSLVEVDTARDRKTAAAFGIRSVPSMIFLASDGRERARVSGFMEKKDFIELLESALDARITKQKSEDLEKLLAQLKEGTVPDDAWPDLMLALGDSDTRKTIREAVLAMKPLPRTQLVGLLTDPRLAVRTGALELLEETAGEDFGFDPWGSDAPEQRAAIADWKQWASGSAETNTYYSALTSDRVEGYIRDILSNSRARSVRAMRMLEQGGATAVAAIDAFLADHPDLPYGLQQRLREVTYMIQLPPEAGMDSAVWAHRLVFGNLGVRLPAIRKLEQARRDALPILVQFLSDPEPLVRETAMETMLNAGRLAAIPPAAEHLKQEQDTGVIIAALRGLGNIRSKRSLQLLTSYLTHSREDIVIIALQNITRLKSSAPSDDIGRCLEDTRWRVRVAALEATGTLGLSDLQPKVEERLSDEDAFVQYKAIEAFAQVSGKSSTAKLEKLFLEEEPLRGAVLKAYGSLDVDLPASFGSAIKGSAPPSLLQVVDGLSHCRRHGDPLLIQLSKHENDDVACAALRVLAARGEADPNVEKVLLAALDSTNTQRVLAVLQAYEAPRDYTFSGSGALSFDDYFLDSPEDEAEDVITDDELNELFDGFLDPGETAVTPIVKEDAPSIHDLMDSFLPEEETPSAQASASTSGDNVATASQPGGKQGFVREATRIMNSSGDESLRDAAAILLLKLGSPDADDYLAGRLSDLTSSKRQEIASSMDDMENRNPPIFLTLLLQDPAKDVRKAAATGAGDHLEKSAWADALFQELLRPDTHLAPSEVLSYHLNFTYIDAAAKKNVRQWALDLLEAAETDELRNLGIILLEVGWKKGDEVIVMPFTDSENPWTRRAAWHALAVNDRKLLEEQVDKLVNDPSSDVRIVLPMALDTQNSNWNHRLDEKQAQTSRYWHYSSFNSRTRKSLSQPFKDALLTLSTDPSPRVRLETCFLLMLNRIPIDIPAFLSTLASFDDQREIGQRTGAFVEEYYKKLGEGFGVLLPYLDYVTLSDADRQKILKHFGATEEEASSPLTLVMRHGKQAATFLDAPEEAVPAAEGNPLVVVYFTEAGCPDCRQVTEYFERLRESIPDLRIEEFEISTLDAQRLNEHYSEQFGVPEAARRLAPAVFSGAGYLIRDDIDFERLADLVMQSSAIPLEDWHLAEEASIPETVPTAEEPSSGNKLPVIPMAILLALLVLCPAIVILLPRRG